MDPIALVWIVLAIVLLVVIIKILKKLFSIALSIIGIAVVVYLVILGLRYVDEKDLRDSLLTSNSLFVLADSDNSLASFASDGKEVSPPTIEAIEKSGSDIYDEYYKIIIINKESLPESIRAAYDSADPAERFGLFRSYVNESILQGDTISNLLVQEKEGRIEVRRESMAFKQSIWEVFGFA